MPGALHESIAGAKVPPQLRVAPAGAVASLVDAAAHWSRAAACGELGVERRGAWQLPVPCAAPARHRSSVQEHAVAGDAIRELHNRGTEGCRLVVDGAILVRAPTDHIAASLEGAAALPGATQVLDGAQIGGEGFDRINIAPAGKDSSAAVQNTVAERKSEKACCRGEVAWHVELAFGIIAPEATDGTISPQYAGVVPARTGLDERSQV